MVWLPLRDVVVRLQPRDGCCGVGLAHGSSGVTFGWLSFIRRIMVAAAMPDERIKGPQHRVRVRVGRMPWVRVSRSALDPGCVAAVDTAQRCPVPCGLAAD